MARLVPMTETEFQTYYESSMQEYAQDHVKAGTWVTSEALQNAEKQYRQLLPDGLASKNQYLFSIEDAETGAKVGILWFAVDDGRAEPSAYIYDIRIREEFRGKGYGTQAMRALEEKVKEFGVMRIALHVFGHNHAARALYEKVGYEIMGIGMSKRIG